MIVRGVDFTSRPTKRKPITCFEGRLDGNTLRFTRTERWEDFDGFEAGIARSGPWIAGLDLPFGQARRFIEAIGWPRDWAGYIRHATSLDRKDFRAALDDFRLRQPVGRKEFRRATDAAARSVSPQKLYGVPVALMFYEGMRRLVGADVHIPGLKAGNEGRIVIEAYPGVLARWLIGRRSYKTDELRKQASAHLQARRDLLEGLRSERFSSRYRIGVEILEATKEEMIADGSGDKLDALLCATQAAWAWTMREENYGMPSSHDPLEGWIADPNLLNAGEP